MKNRAKRRAERRARVERAERVKPPPEAAQHRRTWPLQALLVAGHPDGIDADEFEAALQIVETFKALTAQLGILPARLDDTIGGSSGLSDRDADRIACWFEWSARLPLGLPTRLVAWIEDELPIQSVELLRRACRQWDRVRSDRAKDQPRGVAAIDKTPPAVLPMRLSGVRVSDIVGRPVNLPAETIYGSAGPPPFTIVSPPTGAQMRQVMPPPVALHRRR
jgi:hypothetical protein